MMVEKAAHTCTYVPSSKRANQAVIEDNNSETVDQPAQNNKCHPPDTEFSQGSHQNRKADESQGCPTGVQCVKTRLKEIILNKKF